MPTSRKPNILFIMTDQQRYDCVGANGNNRIRTPNIDALAAESANFGNCFCQAPVCVPSRQTYFTGRYPHSHRNRVNYTPLDPSETLMQARLREAGYTTGFVGKLHYWPPTREHALGTGFDHGLIHDAGPTDAYSDYIQWLEANTEYSRGNYRECRAPSGGGNPFTAIIPDEYHETTWCGRETRAMLREMSAQDRPFFLFSSYWKPHSPFEVPEPWASMYNDVDIPLPKQVDLDYIEGLPLPLQRLILRGLDGGHRVEPARLQWMWRSYYAAVSHIDREVGQTLELLDELGLKESTIVIFCSDHGDLLMEHGINGKNAFFENAIRVPFMIRLPGVIRAQTHRDLVETTDVLPTVFELAKIPVPVSVQGRSFVQLLTGESIGSAYTPREYVFGENIIPEVITGGKMDFEYRPNRGIKDIRHPDAKMVRSRRWKYVRYVGHGEELYDLKNDPGEMRNLASNIAYTAVVRELRDALLDWLITADETDQIAPQWLV